MTVRHGLATAAILALAMLGALGCGSGGGGASVAEAKQKLVDDCHKGHEGDDADLNQCKCIAAQLETKANYRRADQFETLRKKVAQGARSIPPELTAAAAACPKGG
jgi:hypothetical protein